MMTTEEFVGSVEEVARAAGDGFTHPNDDWLPSLHVETRGQFLSAGFPAEALANEEAKDALCLAIVQTGRLVQATQAAVLTSTFSVHGRGEVPSALEWLRDHGTLRDHPDRVEQLHLVVCSKSEEDLLLYNARILRDGEQPPALAPFERAEGATLGGRFPDAVRGAVR